VVKSLHNSDADLWLYQLRLDSGNPQADAVLRVGDRFRLKYQEFKPESQADQALSEQKRNSK
jgi:hypothetical protein